MRNAKPCGGNLDSRLGGGGGLFALFMKIIGQCSMFKRYDMILICGLTNFGCVWEANNPHVEPTWNKLLMRCSVCRLQIFFTVKCSGMGMSDSGSEEGGPICSGYVVDGLDAWGDREALGGTGEKRAWREGVVKNIKCAKQKADSRYDLLAFCMCCSDRSSCRLDFCRVLHGQLTWQHDEVPLSSLSKLGEESPGEESTSHNPMHEMVMFSRRKAIASSLAGGTPASNGAAQA